MKKLLLFSLFTILLSGSSAFAQYHPMPECNPSTGYDVYGRNDHPPGVNTTFPAYGHTDATAGVVPSTGLGEPGYGEAIQGRVMGPCDSGAIRVTLVTGSYADTTITVTISYDLTVPPYPAINTSCFAQPVWTETWYAEGYPIPFWPTQTKISDIQYDRDAHTATVFIETAEWQYISSVGLWIIQPQALAPWSNYSLNILCPPRDQGTPGT